MKAEWLVKVLFLISDPWSDLYLYFYVQVASAPRPRITEARWRRIASSSIGQFWQRRFLGLLDTCFNAPPATSRIHAANGKGLWSPFEKEIHFVLTHPNGWGSYEQLRFQMRRAAVLAWLVPGNVFIRFATKGEMISNKEWPACPKYQGKDGDYGGVVTDSPTST